MLNPLLALHVLVGLAAVLVMVIPLVSPKGGRLHRQAGWLYVGGMVVVCATGLMMSGARAVTAVTDLGRDFALMLSYAAVLTVANMWAGLRVLRAKDRQSRGPAADIVMALLLAASSAVALTYGWRVSQPMLIVFASVGLLNGAGQVMYWVQAPRVQFHWWYAHMGNMLGACITTVTAFALFLGRHVGSGESLTLWFAPTVAGIPLIALWTIYYRRRFRLSGAERPLPNAGVYSRP